MKILSHVQKPGRYIGGEVNSSTKKFSKDNVNVVFAFPDVYEVGMSHLGIKILYHMLNEIDDVAAQRVFSPWPDMVEMLEAEKMPLFSLETKTAIKDFDLLGFSLQYELNYTNILQILDLSNIPFKSADRENGDYPIIISGGSGAFNPEPLSFIIDVFVIGDAEKVMVDIVDIVRDSKKENKSRQDVVSSIQEKIPCCYAPAINRKKQVVRCLEQDLENLYFPTKQIVPYLQTIHDRAVLEIMRGCNNVCRFCQAGVLSRPARERSLEILIDQAKSLIKSTGYEEIGLLSLSSADHSQISDIIIRLVEEAKSRGVSCSMPSLRVNAFTSDLISKIAQTKKTGLTFALEAGSERLRTVLKKDVDIDEFYKHIHSAKKLGWKLFKLYFMIGLPTETGQDIDEMIAIINDAGKYANLNVSISNFVPKTHTPFQWMKMADRDYLIAVQQKIYQGVKKNRRIKVKFHDVNINTLENIIGRGDERLNNVIIKAYEIGCVFDAWTEHFSVAKWEEAFKLCGYGLDDFDYEYDVAEELPWDYVDCGTSKKFMASEYLKVIGEEV